LKRLILKRRVGEFNRAFAAGASGDNKFNSLDF